MRWKNRRIEKGILGAAVLESIVFYLGVLRPTPLTRIVVNYGAIVTHLTALNDLAEYY